MDLNMTEVRSVRIICDTALKDGVLKQLNDLGASGFTWWQAHEKGHRETVPDVETMSGWQRSGGGEDRIMIEIGVLPNWLNKSSSFVREVNSGALA